MASKLVIQKANTDSPRLKMVSSEDDIGARCAELQELLKGWDAASRIKLWRYIRMLRINHYLGRHNPVFTSTVQIVTQLHEYDSQRSL